MSSLPDLLRRHRLTLVALALLGVLWFMVINAVRVEWTVNAQYTYGWIVPLLAIFLFLKRWSSRPAQAPGLVGAGFWLLVAALAAVLLPARLIQEANPDWRLNVWLLASAAIGLTLAMFYAAGGRAWLRHFGFPVAFFLVAVPWPTLIEAPLVQWLTRLNVAVTVEILHGFAIPALQRGNLIEIAVGLVGIEEACSGIRSFQSGVMLALFFGEMAGLRVSRRVGLLLAGLALGFGANLCRTLALVTVALRQGTAELQRWHDPAGMAALGAMFAALWGLSRWFARREVHPSVAGGAVPPAVPLAGRSLLPGFALLAGWLVVVEAAVEAWYRVHERKLGAPVTWEILVPVDRPAFQSLPLTEAAQQILRFDEGINARWREPDGTAWQVIFLRWNPGRVGVQLAKNHTPEICLTAAGRTVVASRPPEMIEVAGLRLPFRSYVVSDRGATAHVFYCLWEDQHPGQTFNAAALNFRSRLAAVAGRRRNLGQRSLELVVWGKVSEAEARAAVQRLLAQILTLRAGAPDGEVHR
jgi:exosortase